MVDEDTEKVAENHLPQGLKRRRFLQGIGMKSLSGNGEAIQKAIVTPQEALRYAMSLPVATTVNGIESLDVLRQNLAIARG